MLISEACTRLAVNQKGTVCARLARTPWLCTNHVGRHCQIAHPPSATVSRAAATAAWATLGCLGGLTPCLRMFNEPGPVPLNGCSAPAKELSAPETPGPCAAAQLYSRAFKWSPFCQA